MFPALISILKGFSVLTCITELACIPKSFNLLIDSEFIGFELKKKVALLSSFKPVF